jgi:threonylcarbamoyladenosine tRNA methylthiotransferase MtaB
LSVFVYTLGCKLNQLESEATADAFRNAGFSLINSLTESSPSLIIINTCTVTSKADQKARRVIRKALKDHPDSYVLVTGCYAQLDKADLLKLDNEQSGRLFVLAGKESVLKLPDYLNESLVAAKDLSKILKTMREQKNIERDVFQFSPDRFSSHTRSFLKIQDGCDKNCTYCRVRLARGPSISLNADIVLERLRILEKNYSEAVLTGVNICRYRDTSGADKMTANNLGGLLEYLISGTSKISLRLSSLEPDSIDENFIKVLSNKRIRPHFHLSIQSGSEKILNKMNRGYNVDTVEKAIDLLRRSKDDPFLACDIITGFPGETDEEFKKTFEMCKKNNFAWIHVFPYSKRNGTAALSFQDSVNEKEITKRAQILTDLAWKGRSEYVRRWLEREVDVLIERGNAEKSFCRGVSENYLKLLISQNWEKAPLPGTILHCKILENHVDNNKDFDAAAEIVKDIP